MAQNGLLRFMELSYSGPYARAVIDFSRGGKKPSTVQVVSCSSCKKGCSCFLCKWQYSLLVKNDGGFFLNRRTLFGRARIPALRIRVMWLPSYLRAIEYKGFQVQKDKYCWNKLLKRHPRNKKPSTTV